MRRVFRLSLLRRRDAVRDIDEEIAAHLAMREERLRAQGLAAPEAARVARARFGDVEAIRNELVRDADTELRKERVMRLFDEVRRDAQFAMRSLARSKAFAGAVIVTLALGIGANATVFSLVNAIVLRPIGGVPHVEGLFELSEGVSYPGYRDLRAHVPALGLAVVRERRIALGRGAAAEHTTGALVSGNFFSTTGVRAALGRTLGDGDDVPGAPAIGVLSHGYWVRSLGADSSVIGRTITVNGAPVTIVGVSARGFRGLHLGADPAVWMPIHAMPVVVPASMRGNDLYSRNWEWLRVVGRTAPGMTLAQAQAALATAMRALDPELSRAELERRSAPRPAQAAALASDARDAVVRFAALLTGAVALVLLAACANIAGLLLARAAHREREIAVRVALGAGRGRLVRQLLTEALVLAGAGGVAGVGVYFAANAMLSSVTLPGGLDSSSLGLGANARVLAFAAAVTITTGLLVGLAPAFRASRPDTVSAIKGVTSVRGSGQHRLHGVLVAAQVAVSVALLVGTGLFSRALTRAFSVDLGFRADGLMAMAVDPGLAQLDRERAVAYSADVVRRLTTLPGVRGASWTTSPPLAGDFDRDRARFDGYAPASDERIAVEWALVGPRFHEVMGIPLLGGRGFDERDGAGAPPVVVVNETLAKRYFAGRSAVGGVMTMRDVRFRIIGVARDTKYHELNESPRPYVYLPLLQAPPRAGVGTPTLVVRAEGDAAPVLPSVIDAVRAANPAVPVYGATTMSGWLRTILAPQLAGAWLLGIFGALALTVAAVGIYGIVAYAVSQRTREIGVRMALGARGASVLRLIAGRNLAFVAAGIPVGLALALLLGRGLAEFLFGVGITDTVTLIGTSALMLIVGLIASYIPARRAVRIDPLVALRE